MGMYILKGKQPVRTKNALAWAEMIHSPKRIVGQNKVGNLLVFFIGLAYFSAHGLFETVVFKKKRGKWPHDMENIDQERYATWDEAAKGHKRMVAKWRKAQRAKARVQGS